KFLLQRWPFGNSLCHIVSFIQAVSVFVSAYTLVAISIDRYMAILWPLRPRMTIGHAKFVILTIWLTAMVTAAPVYVTTGQTQPDDRFYEFCEFYICGEEWEDPDWKKGYSILVAFLQYGVPLVVLVFTYTSIAIVVWGKQPPGEAENQRDRRMAKSKRKVYPTFLFPPFFFFFFYKTLMSFFYYTRYIVISREQLIIKFIGEMSLQNFSFLDVSVREEEQLNILHIRREVSMQNFSFRDASIWEEE
ncbi:hypothetical protein WDU94_011836, partial [Cyamophila willieti]